MPGTPPSKSLHASLTETFCARIRPAEGAIVDYYDIRLANLSLRVTPPSKQHRGGLLTWRFGYRHKGKPGIITIGRYPEWSADKALLKARKIQVMLDEGMDPGEALRPEPAPAPVATPPIDTVKAVVWRYEKDWLSQKSDTHRRNTSGIFARHVIPVWEDRDIRSIRRRDLVDVHNNIKAGGHLVAANRFSSTMTAWFRYLVKQGILESSPADTLPRVEEKPRERSLSLAELVLVWRAAEELGGPAGRFVQLLIAVPVRRDEAAGLPRNEVDNDKREWLLPADRNKSGRDFLIPLSTLARSVLDACPDTGSYYFSVSGRRPIGGFTNVKAKLDIAIAELQGPEQEPLKHWTFHDIRRSISTRLAELGVSSSTKERVLNHALPKLERTYDRYSYAPEKRQALQLWSDHFSKALIDSRHGATGPAAREAAD